MPRHTEIGSTSLLSLGESLLREWVSLACPRVRKIFNFRPDWLREPCANCLGGRCQKCSDKGYISQPLELDIYLPEIAVALEFQGKQHSSSLLPHHKGLPPTRRLRRDNWKIELCLERDIILYQIHPNQLTLSEMEKIFGPIPDSPQLQDLIVRCKRYM